MIKAAQKRPDDFIKVTWFIRLMAWLFKDVILYVLFEQSGLFSPTRRSSVEEVVECIQNEDRR